MSLYKQLLILISALFLLVFGVNLTLSIGNSKTYLETEAQSHAQDTATSLGLSLSPYMKYPQNPTIKAMISAIFDMGYYGEIRLTDANGSEVVTLANDKRAEGVPAWFIALLPISPATANSEISSGWTISGTVYVTVNPAYAYASLYRQAKTSLYYSLATLAISTAMLVLLLRVTLASLKRIDQLAQTIADGRFETMTPLPWTREVKNVALSMNSMSQKIKGVIHGLNAKLETIGAKLLRDELTGLFKKSVFETDIRQLLMDHSPAFLLLLKVDSLPELVKAHGSDAIDDLLRGFSAAIQQQAERQAEKTIKAYRFYGGDFALIYETENNEHIENLCKGLTGEIFELGKRFDKLDLAHIGASPIDPTDTPDNILAAAQEAYEQARLIGANGYHIQTDRRLSRDISTWKALVFECIERQHFTVSYSGEMRNFQDNRIILQEACTQVLDEQGQAVPIAPFISIAEKYAKIVELDQSVVKQALLHIRETSITHAIAVNLSTRTIKNADFLNWLESLFKTDGASARQLIFSFSAYAVSKDADAFVSFFNHLHRLGGRAMIKRFEPQSMLPPGIVKRLQPDFIRLARDIGNGISRWPKQHDFVHTLLEMAQLLEIAILAENVQTDEDYLALKTIGIKGASR
ncbi:MAG: LapD/MoxY N-terminal periplasmic domain-containing protein [Methylomonas sp.]|nr:LapD/MoxY N-terminal periplasmic domain-containing protein [Methylomonas sp.]